MPNRFLGTTNMLGPAITPRFRRLGIGYPQNYFSVPLAVNGTIGATAYTFMDSTGSSIGLNGGRIELRAQAAGGYTGVKFTQDGAAAFADFTNSGSTIISQSAANIPLKLRGAAAQSGRLLELQNSSSTPLSGADEAGRFLAPLGALATCGYAFIGDPNTGLFSTSADDVSVVAGGVDRLRLNGTGVGFFAATPVAQQANVSDPAGGATVDAEARTAINSVLDILQAYGLMAA